MAAIKIIMRLIKVIMSFREANESQVSNPPGLKLFILMTTDERLHIGELKLKRGFVDLKAFLKIKNKR